MVVYDLRAVAEEFGIGADALFKILVMFADELQQTLAEIESAVNGPDWSDLTAAFHCIKGTAANLRVKKLAEIARNSEVAAQQQDIVSVRQQLPKLQSEVRALNNFLATL